MFFSYKFKRLIIIDFFFSYLNKLAEFLKLFVSLHFKRLEAEPEFDAIEFLSYLFQYTFQVRKKEFFSKFHYKRNINLFMLWIYLFIPGPYVYYFCKLFRYMDTIYRHSEARGHPKVSESTYYRYNFFKISSSLSSLLVNLIYVRRNFEF